MKNRLSQRWAKYAGAVAMASAMIAGSAGAGVLGLTDDAPGSTAENFGSSRAALYNDPFAYDPSDPTGTLPVQVFSPATHYHAAAPEGTDVTLNSLLSGGAFTTTVADSIIVVDVYGRSDHAEATDEGTRDNDFDVFLLNGGAVVATVSGLHIDQDVAGDHARATFDSLAVGTTFDGIRIVGHDTTNPAANYFTLAEVAAASVPEPGSLALLGLGGLCLVRRHQ